MRVFERDCDEGGIARHACSLGDDLCGFDASIKCQRSATFGMIQLIQVTNWSNISFVSIRLRPHAKVSKCHRICLQSEFRFMSFAFQIGLFTCVSPEFISNSFKAMIGKDVELINTSSMLRFPDS